MKRAKRLTKREKKDRSGPVPVGNEAHIHCVACGRHINANEFTQSPIRAGWIKCAHGTKYASCTRCMDEARDRLVEHDRTGKAVQVAPVWH